MPGVMQEDLIQSLLDAAQFIAVDQNFFGGSAHSSQGLVNHDAGVGKRVTFAGGAGGELISSPGASRILGWVSVGVFGALAARLAIMERA